MTPFAYVIHFLTGNKSVNSDNLTIERCIEQMRLCCADGEMSIDSIDNGKIHHNGHTYSRRNKRSTGTVNTNSMESASTQSKKSFSLKSCFFPWWKSRKDEPSSSKKKAPHVRSKTLQPSSSGVYSFQLPDFHAHKEPLLWLPPRPLPPPPLPPRNEDVADLSSVQLRRNKRTDTHDKAPCCAYVTDNLPPLQVKTKNISVYDKGNYSTLPSRRTDKSLSRQPSLPLKLRKNYADLPLPPPPPDYYDSVPLFSGYDSLPPPPPPSPLSEDEYVGPLMPPVPVDDPYDSVPPPRRVDHHQNACYENIEDYRQIYDFPRKLRIY